MKLEEHLLRIIDGFEHSGVRHALVGGMAMAFYGFPRNTVDIDFLVHREDIRLASSVLDQIGDHLDAQPMRFRCVRILRQTFVDPVDRAVIPIDLLVVDEDWVVQVWDRLVAAAWRGRVVRILPEDAFVALKSLRNSLQDQADIAIIRGELR